MSTPELTATNPTLAEGNVQPGIPEATDTPVAVKSDDIKPTAEPMEGLAAEENGGGDGGDTPTPPAESFLEKLYAALQQFFYPGGGQYFALQFPGRFLQMSQYAWDTKTAGIYGQFVKPVVVNESEFRLTDQLYDVAEIVAGPNGVNLSIVYDQILNNLLPIFQDTGLGKQQNEIRKWLLKEVKISPWIRKLLDAQQRSSDGGSGITPIVGASSALEGRFAMANKVTEVDTVNRLELSNALLEEYLQAKQAWELERGQMIEEALELQLGSDESSKALNKLTRRLAHITALRQNQLATKWADAVVRGYYHNIREYMGYMDIKSSAEVLQDAKDSLREASMSSLDGALKVYPVQMSPIDWFEALSTSFTMEDLTQDPTLLEQQINAKSRQLDLLNAQMAMLVGGTKGNVEELESRLSVARSALDQAQAKLTASYTNNIINMVKTCVTAAGELSRAQMNTTLGAGGLGLATTVLDSLQADFQTVLNAQSEVVTASRVYTQALDAWALAQGTDTRQQQELLRLQTAALQKELDELTARYQILNKTDERLTAPPEDGGDIKGVELIPSASTAGGSRWQEIRMSQTIQSDYAKSQDYSYTSVKDSSSNLWLFSSGSSSEFTSGGSESNVSKQTDQIELGFRATLVTVDRAGWFQPQFFKQSGSYYHVNQDARWTRYPPGIETAEQLKDRGAVAYQEVNKGRLPAFPVGYVICKDITIKISYDASRDKVKKDFMKSSSTRSRGILCFSTSSSTAESNSSNAHSFQSFSNGCIIRIPGPQILGYIMQLTDSDRTERMPRELPDNFFIPDADYDSTTGTGGMAMFSAEPPPKLSLFDQVETILRDNNIRESTIKDALGSMRKEFDDLSGDMSARIGTDMKL